MAEGMCAVREPPFSSVICANCPVLWMMDPSFRERIKVDCTPGREVRCESSAETCWGTCCVRFGGLLEYLGPFGGEVAFTCPEFAMFGGFRGGM